MAGAGIAGSGHSARQRGWCRARSSAEWRRVLARHVVPLSRKTSAIPWTLAHDGRSFFATVYSPSFSGVGRIDARANRITRIKAFPDPDYDQADGAFDGRWLVWTEYHGFESFDDFTVWAWDSRTGDVRQLGAATHAPDGQFWSSPWRGPDVRFGVATWAQGSGPDGLTSVHVYDLRTGSDRVVRVGHAQGSFLVAGRVVVWPESPARGAETRMYAFSIDSGSPVRAPRALRLLQGISGLATDGRRIAYPDARYRSLWWSPSLDHAPTEVVGTRGDDHVDNSVRIGGRYIGFGIQPRIFVGDMRTRRYVEISGRGGSTAVDSTALLVSYASRVKALHPILETAFVPLRDLPPMPPCS